jgi:hypothetical protein
MADARIFFSGICLCLCLLQLNQTSSMPQLAVEIASGEETNNFGRNAI